MIRPATQEQLHRITHFLLEEAEVLDNREYQKWIDTFFTEEFHYESPARIHRWQSSIQDDWAVAREIGGEDSAPVTKHNRATLQLGIDRILTGKTVNYNPPWFTERLISNIIADQVEQDSALNVRSKFVMHRFKAGERQIIPGHRVDTIVEKQGTLKISKRCVIYCADSYLWGDYGFI